MISKLVTKRQFGIVTTQRNPTFAKLNSKDIQTFQGILGNKAVITGEDELAAFNTDWTKKFTGSS